MYFLIIVEIQQRALNKLVSNLLIVNIAQQMISKYVKTVKLFRKKTFEIFVHNTSFVYKMKEIIFFYIYRYGSSL